MNTDLAVRHDLKIERQQEALRSLLCKPMRDGETRLRNALREEKLRSLEYMRTCRELELKVMEMKQQLKEAEGRGEDMKELVDELAAARMRSSALAKELAEQAYAVSIPRESDGLVPKAPVVPTDEISQSVLYYTKLVFMGLALLVSVVLVALGTLALTYRTVKSFHGGGSMAFEAHRNIY